MRVAQQCRAGPAPSPEIDNLLAMTDADLLRARMSQAGLDDVEGIAPAAGGLAALAGLATRRDGSTVFVKTFAERVADDVFAAEADGLAALRAAGATTPDVVAVTPDLLALAALRPRPDDAAFWERLAHTMARLHTSTLYGRFGWHRDNWLGRCRQDNTWHDDGHEFFARHRVLRWLPEPRVRAALSPADRHALERLCDRLPELLPVRPACLTHGDLWSQNIIATADGAPALIDPAVSYTWAEVDLSMLW
jgi:fructosamine-3-kinase